MRSRRYLLGVCAAVIVASAGCTARAPEEPVTSEPAAAKPVAAAGQAAAVPLAEVPAASAGGACTLLDYAYLEDTLGVLFDVAAGDRVEATATCVVRSADAPRPDLALTVIEQTEADAELFSADLVPEGADRVRKLGKAGYRTVTRAGDDRGPVVEVGWLAADQQVLTLRFTFAIGASADDAEGMADRLLVLARNLSGDDAGR